MLINLKKGAMFGLDARIALAIFGALSVISGAALYSAISSAKAERFNQYFIEHVKASEQYLLDFGTFVPQMNDYYAYAADLVTNRESSNLWKGPYINGERWTDYQIRDEMKYEVGLNTGSFILLLQSSAWSTSEAVNKCPSVGDSDCSEYIVLNAATTDDAKTLTNIFNALDEKIDNSDGKTSGNIRYYTGASNATPHYIAYKGIPRKRSI